MPVGKLPLGPPVAASSTGCHIAPSRFLLASGLCRHLVLQKYHVFRTDHFPGLKGETSFAVRKVIPRNYVYLPPLVSVEATGVCLPAGNSRILFEAVYKSLGRAWSDAVTELLSFRNVFIIR